MKRIKTALGVYMLVAFAVIVLQTPAQAFETRGSLKAEIKRLNSLVTQYRTENIKLKKELSLAKTRSGIKKPDAGPFPRKSYHPDPAGPQARFLRSFKGTADK